MIEKLFSPQVVTVEADSHMRTEALYPEEAAFVCNAVAERRREFAAGRSCARQALRILGVDPQPILVGEHREPLWPGGVVGSLTHCGRYCAVAVAHGGRFAGLGVDAEASERLDPELIPVVCTPSEVDWVRSNPPPAYGDWHKVIFSAKESVYKCIFPLVRRVLDHPELEIRLQPSSHRFSVELRFEPPEGLGGLSPLWGRFEIGAEYIVTGVTLCRTETDCPC